MFPAYFSGKWSLERLVFQQPEVLFAKAYGVAEFQESTANDTMLYSETGNVFPLKSQRAFRFYRNYLYQFDRNYLAVWLNDEINKNVLFQEYIFDPLENKYTPKQEHLCNKDRYTALFKLNEIDTYFHSCKVVGPYKDFFINTTFTRLAKPAS